MVHFYKNLQDINSKLLADKSSLNFGVKYLNQGWLDMLSKPLIHVSGP